LNKGKELATKFANSLKPVFDKVAVLFKKLLTSGLLKKITDLFPCIETSKGASQQALTTIKAIKDKLKLLANGGKKEVVSILVDLVCNFTEFKAAIEFFVKASKETNVVNKFQLTGQGFGRLLIALAKSRRRHHRRF